MNAGEIILSTLAPALETIAAAKFVEVLQKLKEKDAAKYKTVIITLYKTFDVSIEPITDSSRTKIDDAIVGAIKSGIEQSAMMNEITLPNLDED